MNANRQERSLVKFMVKQIHEPGHRELVQRRSRGLQIAFSSALISRDGSVPQDRGRKAHVEIESAAQLTALVEYSRSRMREGYPTEEDRRAIVRLEQLAVEARDKLALPSDAYIGWIA